MGPRRPRVLAVVLLLTACEAPEAKTPAGESRRARSGVPPSLVAPRPWSVDDTLALVRLGGVSMSPDGAWTLYTERRLDWEKNARVRTHFLVPSRGGAARKLPELDKARGARFAPDGARIAFVARVQDDDQVLTVGLQGGPAAQVTRHRGGVDAFAWSPDGSRLYFAAERPRDPAEQDAREAGDDAVFVGEDGNGLEAGRWTDLWVLDVATGAERRLTHLAATIRDLDVAPDGERVAFIAHTDNRENESWRSELYVADRRNGMVLQLTDNAAPEERPRWSPDGRWITYHSPDAKWYDLRHGYLWLVNPLTGDARRLEGQHRGELKGFWWTPDGKRILFGESRGVDANLFELDIESGEVRSRTNGAGTLVVQAFSSDGSSYAYLYEDDDSPADLFVSTTGSPDPVRLTHANPWVGRDVAVAPSEVVKWKSSDDREMEGILTRPLGVNPGAPFPLVVDIHGGPPDHWGWRFEEEHQLLAAMGYAVFAPNIRGSSSYGDEHLRALMGDVGGGEYLDLMSGVDSLVARGVADPARLALRGWSWGGILGAWTLTRTKRFKAAALGAMVGDWAAEAGSGVMFDLRLHYIGCEPWEDPEEWARRSAMTYVKNVKTPTLLLHGERDDVSTVGQSQRFYDALRGLDVPVRLVKFPREGHDFDEPRHRRIALVEELRWFERHVKGSRWSPPARDPGAVPEAAASDRSWLEAGRTLSEDGEAFVKLMEESHVPGMSAAVVKQGKLVWSGAFGWADAEARIPATDETLFQLASVTKTVTATVVMQLAEAGALDLDADIDKVLPFSVRNPAYPGVPITTRMLLTHTSSLRDNWLVLEGTWVVDRDYPLSTRDSIEAYFRPGGSLYSASRNFQSWAPGTRHRYANVGFALLALVAESAAKVPFEKLARERVLAPLAIVGGYRLDDVKGRRVAVPHRWTADLGFERLGHHGYLDYASGTLRTSATGLARFLQAYQSGGALDGARILKEATVADILRVQFPDMDDEQGLGWALDTIDGQRFWGHDGGDPGVATQMYFRPSDGVGFVLLLNAEPRGRDAERRFVDRLLAIGAREPTATRPAGERQD